MVTKKNNVFRIDPNQDRLKPGEGDRAASAGFDLKKVSIALLMLKISNLI